MTPDRVLKRYYWELCKLTHCDWTTYKDANQNSLTTLYLYKCNQPSIMVKLHYPTQKIHSWVFNEVEILQKLNDNPKISHWKSTHFPFRGEFSLTALSFFNKLLNGQIEQNMQKKSKELENWMQAEIIDIFAVTTRRIKEDIEQHSICEIRPLIRTKYLNYFQLRRWSSKAWEELLEIAASNQIQQTYGFGKLFEEINEFFSSFQVVKDTKYSALVDQAGNRKASKKASLNEEYQINIQKKHVLKHRSYQGFQS